MLGLFPPKKVKGLYFKQDHYVSYIPFSVCSNGSDNETGICGWVPNTRLKPFVTTPTNTSPPSNKPVRAHPPTPVQVRQVQLPPRPLHPPIQPPIHIPTPKEKETEIRKSIACSPDIPDEIPVRKTIGKLGLMQPTPLRDKTRRHISPQQLCQGQLPRLVWMIMVTGHGGATP